MPHTELSFAPAPKMIAGMMNGSNVKLIKALKERRDSRAASKSSQNQNSPAL